MDHPGKSNIQVSGITVEVVHKDIKNLHLSVLPPNGRVRVSVPLHVSKDRVRAAVSSRLPWIRAQQRDFANQPRQSARDMVTGETHFFEGKRYRLEVIERYGKHEVTVKGDRLMLRVRPGTTTANRRKVLNKWYREQLTNRIPILIDRWQSKIGVTANDWGIKKMKTKWGSCNTSSKRIWLNQDLACKPKLCLEYIVVHELVHLLERTHNGAFRAHMDKFMPNWRLHRDLLNNSPLANEQWKY